MMMRVLQFMMSGAGGGIFLSSSPQFGGLSSEHCPRGFSSNSPSFVANSTTQFLGAKVQRNSYQKASTLDEQWSAGLPAPLQRYSAVFEKYGEKHGVDPRFLGAISMLETNHGKSSAFRNKNNAMGVSNRSGPVRFSSVEQSIERMARVLASPSGPYAGKRTIGEIAGVYCPVGAGNDVNGTNHHWPRLVSKFYQQLGGDPQSAVM